MPNAMLKAAKKTLWPHYTTHLPVKEDVLLCFVEILSTFLASLDNLSLSPWFIPCFFFLSYKSTKEVTSKIHPKSQKTLHPNQFRSQPKSTNIHKHRQKSASNHQKNPSQPSQQIPTPNCPRWTSDPWGPGGAPTADASALLHPSAAELGPSGSECGIHEPRIPRLETSHFFGEKKGCFGRVMIDKKLMEILGCRNLKQLVVHGISWNSNQGFSIFFLWNNLVGEIFDHLAAASDGRVVLFGITWKDPFFFPPEN